MKYKLSLTAGLVLSVIMSSNALALQDTVRLKKPLPSNDQLTYIGYWNNLNTNNAGTKANPTLLQTAQAGYTIIPVAFGVIQGTDVSLYNNQYNNNGYGVDVNYDEFIKDVQNAQAQGAKILLTFGGGSNSKFSWNPDPNNPQAAADSVIDFLAKNKLDGVDFDLEAGMNTDQSYLKSFITELRKQAQLREADFAHGFTITGAPQLVSSHEFMWNGNTSLNELLASDACGGVHCFDYLSIQDYNNNPQPSLSDAYDAVYSQMDSNNNDGTTKIILGVPATTSDGQGYMTPEVIKEEINTIENKSTAGQFAGIMVWTASSDYTEGNWSFISQIK
ncbi:glycosyl hydrolase family 18 protein [Thiotrichales bacterium 19S3-7]|nr:glycosyl hydrolase family 18 protein [Thiotrichales bacterium 19S3-7]MCF6801361.1 glycosyl hydrolase family 18 protein [Thiotrichales bacterium 19S3-11]